MDIDKLTVGEARQLASLFSTGGNQKQTHSLPLGKNVFIRTVTYHYTGFLNRITDTDIVLTDAAWIAYSGRWNQALKTGILDEVEPFPDEVILPRGGIVDCTEWRHSLPREVK